MSGYDHELSRLQQEIIEKKRADAKLSDLLIQQSELKKRVYELERQKMDEQKDVDQLQSRSLKAFFYRITGKMGEKLTKEQTEAYAAALRYDAAEGELRAVNKDIEDCKKTINDFRWCQQEYEKAFEKKLAQIKASGSEAAQKILQLEHQDGILKGQKKEVEEAIRAGGTAQFIAGRIIENLNSAKSWSTVDLIGGGILADIAKYDKLDNVQENVKQLQNALRNFRTELADVKEEIAADIHPEVGDFLHFADYFFDGLFVDWTVRNKIEDSLSRANETYAQIQNVMGRLNLLNSQITARQEQVQAERTQIVASTKVEEN